MATVRTLIGNIKGPQGSIGPQGPQGNAGPQGPKGEDAVINGENILNIVVTGGLTSSQTGNTFTIDGSGIETSSSFNTEYNGTLLTTGWVLENGQYYFQININNMSSLQKPIVIPQWTTNQNNEQIAWGLLSPTIETFEGYVRFYSPSPIATQVNFTIYYKS